MNTIDKNIFLNTAWKIGCELIRNSLWHNDSCNWQGYAIEQVDGVFKPVIRTFGSDIYSGTSGIAIFLSALYQEKKDPMLLKTIEGCVAQIKQNMNVLPDHGFYAGKPGVAYALIQLGENLDRKQWTKLGLSLLESIAVSPLKNHELDLISGAAGTIPVLLNTYTKFNQQIFLDKAIALGNMVCEVADKNHNVWSWPTVPSKRNLTGFSHGASGIALALLQLFKITNNETYLQAANAGFNYERQVFDSTQQNWPDLRDDVTTSSNTNVCGMAWCHGAPGIALARHKANVIMPNATYQLEMDTALNTTTTNIHHNLIHQLLHTNYSLCHGIAGNADVLIDCGGLEHLKLAEAVGIAGIQKYQNNDLAWPTGLNTNQYTPGLMMGIAGTGYFYLRLLNKEKYKSILLPE